MNMKASTFKCSQHEVVVVLEQGSLAKSFDQAWMHPESSQQSVTSNAAQHLSSNHEKKNQPPSDLMV